MELKIYTAEQLAEIKGGERADLRNAYLAGAYLTGAYLRNANLTGANLTGAYLTGANLTGANLTGAYLPGAYLRNANLTGANLTGANLTGANLTGARFKNCNLSGVRGILSVACDWRGYNLVRWTTGGGVKMYNSGCQCLTFDEAIARWGDAGYANTLRGDLYVNAVRWLDSLPVEEWS